MYTLAESVTPLLPLLRCPRCFSDDTLDTRHGPVTTAVAVPLLDTHLLCQSCTTQYPITDDFIPILWDADLHTLLSGAHGAPPDALRPIRANMAIYDSISDDYHLYSRRDPGLTRRMQNAARRIFPDLGPTTAMATPVTTETGARYHLDFGCGPGHVIGWLKDFGFRQIGLDVSLNNLRNARKHTGCLVVCGNACNLPFAKQTMDLVTESSALHHILDWKRAVTESLRVCKTTGGIVIDSEPSKAQLAWSPLAIRVFNLRFPVYYLLSHVFHEKYAFRRLDQARLNLQAEIHHQPGTGFPLDEFEALFRAAGFAVDIILSPTPELTSRASWNWKMILLNLLSARNPWNPEFGAFTAIGHHLDDRRSAAS